MTASHPRLTVETSSSKQAILILAHTATRFVHMLKRKLEAFDNHVVITDHLPHRLDPYIACFFFNASEKLFREMISTTGKKSIFIFFDQKELAERCVELIANHRSGTIKVISLETSFDYYERDIEAIFWFSFAPGSEKYLPIYHPRPHVEPVVKKTVIKETLPKKRKLKPFTLEWVNQFLRPRYTIGFILGLVVLVHVLFVPALALATWDYYRAAQSLRARDMQTAKSLSARGSTFLSISQFLYSYVRPTYSLFSASMIPDTVFLVDSTVDETISNGITIDQHGKEFADLFFNTTKTPAQVEYMVQLKDDLGRRLLKLNGDLSVLNDKLPTINSDVTSLKDKLADATQMIELAEKFFPHLDSIFARNTEKKYLVLFANNMELRPGGGFIGSFAVVDVKNYTIASIKVYDVYDADGQLTDHVRPPAPIETYLNQPHWYLRDSAFSPDFNENYEQAKYFLNKEMSFGTFDGGILITTSAIRNILGAMDSLYLPDFRETVTADNFYIKAQLHAEGDFFPGSRQKKTFLSSVMNQMLISLPQAAPTKLFDAIEKSLNEKQIVMNMTDKDIQKTLDTQYWSGRIIKPACTSGTPNCMADYLFPYDANLGVNKANFYVTKNLKLNVSISDAGTVSHRLVMQYRNDSYPNIFPGGPYKNYFQLLLPPFIRMKGVTVDGTRLNTYDLKSDEYTRLGFLMSVAPRSTSTVVIDYDLGQQIAKGNGAYQLVLQKQIGSANSDVSLSMTMPKHLYVTNKNFTPLVKGNTVGYNTSLSADKIFYIEFFLEDYGDKKTGG